MSSCKSILRPRKSKQFRWGFKRYLLSGILILVPFTVTLLVVLWLFRRIQNLISPLIAHVLSLVADLPELGAVPSTFLKALVFIITILMLLAIFYLIGVVGTRVLGKRLIALVEGLIKRIPLAGALYGASKQVVEAFGGTDKPAYKSVVLVEFPRTGCKALGFLTGFVELNENTRYAKVIIPTAPNPTTGFFELFPADQIEEVNVTMEEAFKMILSVGLVSPDNLIVSSAAQGTK
jgi:uncharacterized membrane protein